ncbi:ATI fragment [Camelpox virus]|uniref:A-type inclusion protein n=3 Tax=Camelpox virus TaxID=28873 RepID=D5LL04_9POXV|nr:ATI fragment [Camelpox virus]AAL73850.1 ATI fragment [Camelpox virus M-96]ADE95829.1 A-type inclusion protein fragment [Camelpox virus]AFK25765.1 ATI fragment [Camelpox virus]AKU40512.1 hypothetical protein TT95_00154 [Camelpox virus]AMR98477.1 A-type inclusion protein [Camelpox virus]
MKAMLIRKEMQRLRDRIMDLDRQLNECKRNGNGTSSEEVNRLKGNNQRVGEIYGVRSPSKRLL